MDFAWVYEQRLQYMRERTELDDPEILFVVVSVAWSHRQKCYMSS